MSKRCSTAFMLAVLTLAGIGCGRSNSSGNTKTASSAESTAPSDIQRYRGGQSAVRPRDRNELIAKADAICAHLNARRAATRLVTIRDFAEKLPGLAAYEHVAYGELSRLVPPQSMAADWRRIVADEGVIAVYTAKIAQYARTDDFKAVTKTYVASTIAQKRLMAGARRAGLMNCAAL